MASKRVIHAALAGNLLVAATKVVAAIITGSSAMLSEAIHSLVDSGDQILLLYGQRRSRQPPHPKHPLGHGRELYFWSFVVALMVFALGAGISIYEGILHIQHPVPIANPLVSYIVLALAFVFEGTSWLIALREVNKLKGSKDLLEAFEKTKDPPSFVVFFEDSAALVGISIAALATFGVTHFHIAVLDGVASILIGLILATIAYGLARETKSLLIGEQADAELTKSIERIAREVSSVNDVNVVFAVQLAPQEVVVALQLRFPDQLPVVDAAAEIREIERRVRERHREVIGVFIRPRDDDA
ncbi:MAG TPA: cation diffusion facilitator family transporter [Gemmatimonadales bacterium]|nr:cation diffusion facilitator family transporter [Gemmatimonadales bacterium]